MCNSAASETIKRLLDAVSVPLLISEQSGSPWLRQTSHSSCAPALRGQTTAWLFSM
jgi:hypothetical protein